LRRLLNGKVDEIITAQTPVDAEVVLKTKPVTHVLCDHFLGPGQPTGLSIAHNWKQNYPSLKKVIILTGTDVNYLSQASGIDKIIPKTVDPVDLIKMLELR